MSTHSPIDSRITREIFTGVPRATCSATMRVTEVTMPAAAKVVPSTYTENTS